MVRCIPSAVLVLGTLLIASHVLLCNALMLPAARINPRARSLALNPQATSPSSASVPVLVSAPASVWRKALAVLLAAALASAPVYASTSPSDPASPGAPAPTRQIHGISKDGRLLSCPKLGNCVSTSAINSIERYDTPWAFGDQTPEEAWKQLVSVISEYKLLHIVEQDDAKFYLRAEAKSAVPPTGIDDVEFLLSPANKVVTYRSNSRERVRIGPGLVSDGGSNKNRLSFIRSKLGWQQTAFDQETDEMMQEEKNMGIFERLKGPSVDAYE